MAKATKKKSTVKRAAKHATHTAVKSARAAQAAWPQQSAKLYQMPFAQGDAADAARAAGENMMRMGSDAMQQWWSAAQSAASNPEAVAGQAKEKVSDLLRNVPSFTVPGFDASAFDASAAQEKLANFGREAAEQFTKSTASSNRAINETMALSKENAEALVEVTNIAVALSKEIGAEMINYCNKSFSQNVELSKQVLACRTLNDMFDLSSKFMKTNLDGFFSESVKLSELLFQASTDVSEPLNERITESTDRISKALAA
jgi:hypothetical protein